MHQTEGSLLDSGVCEEKFPRSCSLDGIIQLRAASGGIWRTREKTRVYLREGTRLLRKEISLVIFPLIFDR